MRFIALFYLFVRQLSIIRSLDEGKDIKIQLEQDYIKILQKDIQYIFNQDSKIKELTDKNITMRHFSHDIPISSGVPANKAELLLKQFKPNPRKVKSLAEDEIFTFDVKERIISEGDLMINNMGYKIMNALNSTSDLHQMLNNASDSYVNELFAYYNFVSKQRLRNEIERVFYILDFIETSNRIFSAKTKMLFNNLAAQMNSSILKADLKQLRAETEEAIKEEKVENLQYTCQKLYICRPFPAYSDFIAKVLVTVLNLPDETFAIVIRLFKQTAEEKSSFFKSFMNKDIANTISSTFKSLNVTEKRRFLSTVKDIIVNRYKIFRSKDGTIKNKVKSLRILIDMIDKAYDVYDDDILNIQFDLIQKDLKTFDTSNSSEVQNKIENYFDDFEDVINSYWNSKTKEDVKALIETITLKIPENNSSCNNELFTEGPKFLSSNLLDYRFDL